MNLVKQKINWLLVLVILLSGCQSITPKRVIDDSTTEAIVETLRDAQKNTIESAGAAHVPPKSVTDGLLPSISGNKINRTNTEARFDIGVDTLAARAFFLGLVKDTRYNIVVHPEVTGDITLNLNDISVPEVLEVVEDIFGYSIKRSGNLYTVLPAGLRTEVFKINYLDIKRSGSSQIRVASGSVSDVGSGNTSNATNTNSVDDNINNSAGNGSLVGTYITTSGRSDFWGELKSNLDLLIGQNPDHRVIVTPQSGMVVVRAMPQELDVVAEFLRSSELIMKRQVILEAKILEVTLNDEFQSGINWTALSRSGSGRSVLVSQGGAAFKGIGDLDFSGVPGSSGIPSANTSNGIFGISISLDEFSGIIDLLETQGAVQVLSSPRISTVNNQKAVIKVGTDEFFVTEVTNTITTSAGGSTNTPSVELTPFFSGIALDVTPQISGENDVILHVHPTVSEVVEQNRSFVVGSEPFNLPLAQSSVRESDSIIYAKNEQVVVIGGLIQSVAVDNGASTPFLSRIPGLGHAFRQKDQKSVKRELVILLKPLVLDHANNSSEIASSLERINTMREQLNR